MPPPSNVSSDAAMAFLRAHAINGVPVALKYNLDDQLASTEVFLRYRRRVSGPLTEDTRNPSPIPLEAEIVRGNEIPTNVGVGLWVGILIRDFKIDEAHEKFSPKRTNLENLLESGRQVFQRIHLGDSKFMRVVAALKSATSKSPIMHFMYLANPGQDGICTGYHRFKEKNAHIFLFSRYRDDTVARGASATKKASKDLIMKGLRTNMALSTIPSSVWGAVEADRETKRQKLAEEESARKTTPQAEAGDGDETEEERPGASNPTSKAMDGDETEAESSELEFWVGVKDASHSGVSTLEDSDDDVREVSPPVARPGPSTMVSPLTSEPRDPTTLLQVVNDRATVPTIDLVHPAWMNFLNEHRDLHDKEYDPENVVTMVEAFWRTKVRIPRSHLRALAVRFLHQWEKLYGSPAGVVHSLADGVAEDTLKYVHELLGAGSPAPAPAASPAPSTQALRGRIQSRSPLPQVPRNTPQNVAGPLLSTQAGRGFQSRASPQYAPRNAPQNAAAPSLSTPTGRGFQSRTAPQHAPQPGPRNAPRSAPQGGGSRSSGASWGKSDKFV